MIIFTAVKYCCILHGRVCVMKGLFCDRIAGSTCNAPVCIRRKILKNINFADSSVRNFDHFYLNKSQSWEKTQRVQNYFSFYYDLVPYIYLKIFQFLLFFISHSVYC